MFKFTDVKDTNAQDTNVEDTNLVDTVAECRKLLNAMPGLQIRVVASANGTHRSWLKNNKMKGHGRD